MLYIINYMTYITYIQHGAIFCARAISVPILLLLLLFLLVHNLFFPQHTDLSGIVLTLTQRMLYVSGMVAGDHRIALLNDSGRFRVIHMTPLFLSVLPPPVQRLNATKSSTNDLKIVPVPKLDRMLYIQQYISYFLPIILVSNYLVLDARCRSRTQGRPYRTAPAAKDDPKTRKK